MQKGRSALNYYDDERMIIEDFQIVDNSEVHFPFRSRGAIDAFKSIRNTKNGRIGHTTLAKQILLQTFSRTITF